MRWVLSSAAWPPSSVGVPLTVSSDGWGSMSGMVRRRTEWFGGRLMVSRRKGAHGSPMAEPGHLTERFVDATRYTSEIHADHFRKGDRKGPEGGRIPSACHLLSVAGLALAHGADGEEAIAALLHDAIEDRPREGRTKREILERFGPRVLDIVVGCSDSVEHIRPEAKPPWKQRKEGFLARLPRATGSVLLVVACDKLDNIRAILSGRDEIGTAVWARFKAPAREQLWYYESAVGILKAADDPRTRPIVRELEEACRRLRGLPETG